MGGAVVYLPVDTAFIEKERSAKVKEIELATAEADAIERKLASEGFVTKAPPDIVSKERARLAQLLEEIRLAHDRLASL
jgi:valyl-tRNA synthetase